MILYLCKLFIGSWCKLFEIQYADKPDSGAVKSNFGHLEGASGFAGLAKAVLAVEKGVIPPNTNFENCNPQIDADFFHMKV